MPSRRTKLVIPGICKAEPAAGARQKRRAAAATRAQSKTTVWRRGQMTTEAIYKVTWNQQGPTVDQAAAQLAGHEFDLRPVGQEAQARQIITGAVSAWWPKWERSIQEPSLHWADTVPVSRKGAGATWPSPSGEPIQEEKERVQESLPMGVCFAPPSNTI